MVYLIRKTVVGNALASVDCGTYPTRDICDLIFRNRLRFDHNLNGDLLEPGWLPTTEHQWEAISSDGRVRGVITEVNDPTEW